MRWKEIIESATSGGTGAASVATAVGGLGAGFNPNGDWGIYQSKRNKPMVIKRMELKEANVVRLGDLCTIKTNFPDADFWIVRRGTKDSLGKPCEEFDAERIGIKVDRTDILLPKYLYHVFEHLRTQGVFKEIAMGALSLVNITTKQVSDLKFKT